MKQTHLHVSCAHVIVFVMRLWMWQDLWRDCACDTGFVMRLRVTQDLSLDCGCDTGFVMRLWVWHRICDETVGVTQDLWWDCVYVWHRICDVTVGVTQDLWWDCGCDTGFVMWLWVWHRICDETVGVTQDLWWDCVCDTGFVMRLWMWRRIHVQLKVSMNVSCFPQYVGWQSVNCEESDCSLVNCRIVCFFGAWVSIVVKALHY